MTHTTWLALWLALWLVFWLTGMSIVFLVRDHLQFRRNVKQFDELMARYKKKP